jgi:hypothetical protein
MADPLRVRAVRRVAGFGGAVDAGGRCAGSDRFAGRCDHALSSRSQPQHAARPWPSGACPSAVALSAMPDLSGRGRPGGLADSLAGAATDHDHLHRECDDPASRYRAAAPLRFLRTSACSTSSGLSSSILPVAPPVPPLTHDKDVTMLRCPVVFDPDYRYCPGHPATSLLTRQFVVARLAGGGGFDAAGRAGRPTGPESAPTISGRSTRVRPRRS